MTSAVARQELDAILVDVRRGVWQPMTSRASDAPKQAPTFHEFASEWFDRRTHAGLSARTIEHSQWCLSDHLLPAFSKLRLDEIDAAAIDAFTARKARGGLSASSINRLVQVLAAILADAVEYDLIARNPAASKRRRLAASKPRRTYLDCAEHISALLDAAGELDRRPRRRTVAYRRALLATLTLSGLRIGEALELRWRDVQLASGTLRVRGTKTAAAERVVTIRPMLRDELVSLAAASRDRSPNAAVFATASGARHSATNIRLRVLAPAIELANKRLSATGFESLPDGLSPHSLRRTFASVLYALGEDPPTVMAEMGHTSPALALGIYAQVMRRGPEERERLRALVEGRDWGTSGDNALAGQFDAHASGTPERPESPSLRVSSAAAGG
jgi:integrase